MSQFYPLRVTHITHDTKSSVVVSLAAEDENRFAYLPGQYLTFRRKFGAEELRRSYSICSSAADKSLRVGIKKVDGGGFSTWANETLAVGDVLEAMPPMGNFTFGGEEAGATRGHYLGVAAGSGITPILSIAKTILEETPNSFFHLIYGNRSLASIMFREEIEDLKNRFLSRFSVNHVLSGGADLELFSGRIDKDKCHQFFNSLISPDKLSKAYICGPEDMMKTVSDALDAGGMARSDIKFELFGASQEGRLAERAKSKVQSKRATTCKTTLIMDGVKHTIDITGDTAVLDAALGAAIEAPYACKAGVCSTCRARVIEGTYEFVTNYALEDYEVEQGYVLSCQCFPTGDKLVITYDDH